MNSDDIMIEVKQHHDMILSEDHFLKLLEVKANQINVPAIVQI
jgi:hypothetical protein